MVLQWAPASSDRSTWSRRDRKAWHGSQGSTASCAPCSVRLRLETPLSSYGSRTDSTVVQPPVDGCGAPHGAGEEAPAPATATPEVPADPVPVLVEPLGVVRGRGSGDPAGSPEVDAEPATELTATAVTMARQATKAAEVPRRRGLRPTGPPSSPVISGLTARRSETCG